MSWPDFEWMFIMFNNFQKIIWELYPTDITGDITTIIIPERGWPQFIETCLEGGCPGQTRGQERTGLTSTLPAYHHHQQNNSNLFSWFSWMINTSGLNVRVGQIVKRKLMRYSSTDWLRNILSGDFLIFLIWGKSFCPNKDILAVSPNQILQDLQLELYILSKFVKGKNQYSQKFSDLVFQLKMYSIFCGTGSYRETVLIVTLSKMTENVFHVCERAHMPKVVIARSSVSLKHRWTRNRITDKSAYKVVNNFSCKCRHLFKFASYNIYYANTIEALKFKQCEVSLKS